MSDSQEAWGQIAVVGRAGRFPAARNVEEFWRLLRDGRVATQRLTDEELLAHGVSAKLLRDPNYVKAANVLPDMECFDAGFFGFSPREASILDPQHRHFLECAFEALEDAGHAPDSFNGRIGVYAGVGMQAYFSFNLLTNPDLVEDIGLFLLRHTGNDKDFLPTRLSYLLNLRGPSVSVQTACSTGLVSVHLAINSLLTEECDLALAGGVTIELPHRVGYKYADGEILSPDGLCRPFDDDSKGTVFGSGCGIVALRRLQDAIQDGDDIKAIILGSAVNNDGQSKVSYLAPSIDGQAECAAEALSMAGIDPSTVHYIEAHGTGTPIGDPIELAGLTSAYRPGGQQFCGIGSVKSNIGHLDTAAGTASLIKVVEALRNECIPPTANFRTPNTRFDFANSPFRVISEPQPWPRSKQPRRAGINSLGVGGTNAHMLVEEAPLRSASPAAAGVQLLPLSARTTTSLDGITQKWREFSQRSLPSLVDVAFTLRKGRQSFDERLVIAARNEEELRQALSGDEDWRLRRGSKSPTPPQIVFLFPGGGAQYPGAGKDLYDDSATFRTVVDQCLDGLRGHAPDDLRTVMLERTVDDEEATQQLRRAPYAIPALFVLEYAYAKWWQSHGIEPELLLAHSVGEYASAVLAGAMPVADALRIVAARGRVMDQAPEGAMTIIPADEATARELVGDHLDIAVVNARDVTVVSGTLAAIENLESRLAATEHEPQRIHIDVAAHSRQLDGQLDEFHSAFEGVTFGEMSIPMVSSLRGAMGEGKDFVSADYWVRHLRDTVRFADAVDVVLSHRDRIVIEVGPGQTLGPLLATADADRNLQAVLASARKPKQVANDTDFATATLGELWTHGVNIDWQHVTQAGGRRVSLPTYAFEKQRHWIDPGSPAQPARETRQAESTALVRRPSLDDWFETTVWVDAPMPSSSTKAAAHWLVLAGADDTSQAVLQQLAEKHAHVTAVRCGNTFERKNDGFVVRPNEQADFEQLFTALDDAPEQILLLWPLGADPGQRMRFDAGFALARALQSADLGDVRLTIATRGQVDDATLHAIAAVAPREIPGLEACRVDVSPDTEADTAAARLLNEATTHGTPTSHVAWSGTRRLQPQRVAAPAPKPEAQPPGALPTRLRHRGVYVITGGTGGIGRALALWLAKAAQVKLALLSRNAAEQDALRTEIEGVGGEVAWFATDVTDKAQLTTTLAHVRQRFGALHGVFHAAGVVADGPLATKTITDAHTLMAPKVVGGANLHELLPEGTIELFCTFSSSSVDLAPAGQIDYVAANAWLDALARSRQDGLSIAWGIWRDIGMAERTFGVADTTAGNHPLLGARQNHDDGSVTFTRRFDPLDDWVVLEHRVGGVPVLPGTAYIEIASAVAQALGGTAAHELQDLSFIQPLTFAGNVPRLVTVRAKPNGNRHDLIIESRASSGADALEHARAHLVPRSADHDTVPRSLQRSAGVPLTERPQPFDPSPSIQIQFGPRWHNIQRIATGREVAAGTFRLADEFVTDLVEFNAHPALLDMAFTVGLWELPDRNGGTIYAPIGIGRVKIFAALPQEVRSRAVTIANSPGQQIVFDVELRDSSGHLLMVFEQLRMRAVPAEGMQIPDDVRLTDRMLAQGIRASDAPELFARVLSMETSHVVVSSLSLDDVRVAIAAASQPTKRLTKRTEARNVEGPNGAVELHIASIWSSLLGAEEIGRDEDFFALGGHSLAAVRMLSRLRKEMGVDLPLTTLFEAPTVRALAKRVLEQRPALAGSAADEQPTAATAQTPPPQSAPAEQTIETTDAQREIYAAILIDPGATRAYNLSYSWHFDGSFDPDAAAAACRDLVDRHDSLRSTFSANGLQLLIRRDIEWQMSHRDLSTLDDRARACELARLHEDVVEQPFDLGTGPVFRATAIKIAHDRWELLFGSHHIATDGWSIGVLMRDFHALYETRRTQREPDLAPPMSITEFVATEQSYRATPQAEQHRLYWLSRFEHGAPVMELPTDRGRPSVMTTAAERLDDRLDPATETLLRAIAQSLGTTLANFVFAAFHLYLGRATGSRDVVVGLPTSGQLAHDLDGVVGHCVNFLPILSHIDPEQTFADYVRDVRQILASALDHQNYTYGSLVRDLRLQRDASRVALVPVIFNIDNLTDITGLSFEGAETKFKMNPRAHEHFELFVNLLDEPNNVLLSWSYNRDIFTGDTMQRHIDRFRQLLIGLANDPKTTLGRIGPLVSGAVRPASGTHEDPGAAGPQTVTEVFRRIAALHGGRTAVQMGAATMDYGTLEGRSNSLAAQLFERGVRQGDLVGITSQRSLDLVVAVIGALKAGAGYVPFDRTLPRSRLQFMAEDTAIKVLLGDCPAVADAGVPTIPFDGFSRAPASAPDARITGADVAYVMFTSGTTGKPKGVVLPHRSIIRMLVDTDWLELSPETVTLHSSAFAFDTSIIDLFGALLHGGKVVIPPDGALTIQQLADSIADRGVNTLWLTSGLFHAMADLRPNVFASVKQVIVGGDIVSPVQVEKVMNACPHVTVINGYGPTESNVTNSHRITRDDLRSGQALPIGRAVPGTQIYIVDEDLRPVESGVQGELCISGRGLALGYHNRTELTADKFVQAPWNPDLCIYRSGDIAMNPGNGVIRFYGRMDGQVKIRGFRVELGEVEAALEAHAKVRQAVVVAAIPKGQTEKVLAAYIVPEGAAPTRQEMHGWLQDRVPEFARPLHYVTLDQIPLNHNGKVDRRELPVVALRDDSDQTPCGMMERRIAEIWCQLLGLDAVGAETNFFELGGHSLLAVRLFDGIREQFGVQLPISTLFQNPTVRTLAATVTQIVEQPREEISADDEWDTSVVIHRGPAGLDQTTPPLFVVGGVGGNVNNLYELGRAVGRHRCVIGFQTRGILGHTPHDSIEAMARDNLRWLRLHQSQGPFLIAGYSGGAQTAFEMARQLRAKGQEVAQLFVFDTFAPGFARDFRPKVKLSLRQRLRSEFDLLREEGLGFFFERLRANLSNTILRRPVQWFIRTFRPAVYRLSKVEDAWRVAAAKYQGGRYDAKVTLLQTKPRALMSRLAYEQDPTVGWSAFTPAGLLARHRVSGDHLRMIQGDNAVALAAIIEGVASDAVPPQSSDEPLIKQPRQGEPSALSN